LSIDLKHKALIIAVGCHLLFYLLEFKEFIVLFLINHRDLFGYAAASIAGMLSSLVFEAGTDAGSDAAVGYAEKTCTKVLM